MKCANCLSEIILNPGYVNGTTHLVEVKVTALMAVGGDGYSWTKHTLVGATVYCSTRCLTLALRAPILHARKAGAETTSIVALCGARVAGDSQQSISLEDDKVGCTNCIAIRNMSAS